MAEEKTVLDDELPLDETIAEVVRISRKREQRANWTIVAGVIWSFTYTAISLLIMWGVSSSANQTCEQFAESRNAVRALILSNPNHPQDLIESIDELLPPIVCD